VRIHPIGELALVDRPRDARLRCNACHPDRRFEGDIRFVARSAGVLLPEAPAMTWESLALRWRRKDLSPSGLGQELAEESATIRRAHSA